MINQPENRVEQKKNLPKILLWHFKNFQIKQQNEERRTKKRQENPFPRSHIHSRESRDFRQPKTQQQQQKQPRRLYWNCDETKKTNKGTQSTHILFDLHNVAENLCFFNVFAAVAFVADFLTRIIASLQHNTADSQILAVLMIISSKILQNLLPFNFFLCFCSLMWNFGFGIPFVDRWSSFSSSFPRSKTMNIFVCESSPTCSRLHQDGRKLTKKSNSIKSTIR